MGAKGYRLHNRKAQQILDVVRGQGRISLGIIISLTVGCLPAAEAMDIMECRIIIEKGY